MAKLSLRIEGVYDQKTLGFLKKLGIDSFGLDFRPLSSQFLPQYQFHEILEKEWYAQGRFYLFFENEKKFVIDHFLTELQKSTHASIGRLQGIFLEVKEKTPTPNLSFPSVASMERIALNDLKNLNIQDQSFKMVGKNLKGAHGITWEIGHEKDKESLALNVFPFQKTSPGQAMVLSFERWPFGLEKKILGQFEELLGNSPLPITLSFGLGPELERSYRDMDEIKLGRWIGFLQELFLVKSISLRNPHREKMM